MRVFKLALDESRSLLAPIKNCSLITNSDRELLETNYYFLMEIIYVRTSLARKRISLGCKVGW